MSVYFFDTSALVKRYVAETGSTWVSHVTHPKSGHKIFIAAITAVGVVSAIMKKVRDTKNPLAQNDAQKAIAEFRNDFANQYEVLTITDSLVQGAMRLPEKTQTPSLRCRPISGGSDNLRPKLKTRDSGNGRTSACAGDLR